MRLTLPCSWRPCLALAGSLILAATHSACPGLSLEDALPPLGPPGATSELVELLACAGADQVRTRGLPATLDGRCSRALGDAALRGRIWRQDQGDRVTLDSAVGDQANLVAPARTGVLDFNLELRGAHLLSLDSARLVVVEGPPREAPVSLASGDVWIVDGRAVLDASRSVGVDTAIQSARWRQLVGAPAEILHADQLQAEVELAPTAAGAVFSVEVQADDGLWSEPDLVVVRRTGLPPPVLEPPQLGAPPFVEPGARFALSAVLADDGDHDRRTLRQLRGDRLEPLELVEDGLELVAPRRPQSLVFRLDQEVEGWRLPPALATVQVTAGIGNRAPVADAGPDRSVRPGHGVAITGSRSRDPDGSPLQLFRWWQALGPTVRLSCHLASCTFEAPDAAVTLAFALVVDDGTAESNADVVVIEVDPDALNQPPVADAGGERWVLPGSEVTLDGRGSDDPDSGRLASLAWEQLPPLAPPVELAQPGDGTATFVAPSSPTTLHLRLTVCDADQACSSDDALVHVAAAGPHVDAVRGLDDGDGTAARPCRTLLQGLEIARRFGLGELRLASGDHVVGQAVEIPAALALRGGWRWDGLRYQDDPTARSTLAVAGVDALSLGSGASLERLVLNHQPATAAVSRRRLVVMGPRSALRGVDLSGPSLADEVVTVDVSDGHRVEISDCLLRGGTGDQRSVVLRAGPASDVRVQDSAFELGRAPQVVGIAAADNQLSLLRSQLRAGDSGGRADEVTGVDAVRGLVQLEDCAIALDDAGWDPTALAVALRCHRCQPRVLAPTQVRGPARVAALGRGVGVSLFLAREAKIGGRVVGGRSSPGAELVALEATGGTLVLAGTTLEATADGLAATAVALALDGVAVQATAVGLQAIATDRALAAQLVGLEVPALELREVHAAAASAWGIADGWQTDLSSPATGSRQLTLDVRGTLQVVGTVEATGVALRGSEAVALHLDALEVTAPQRSDGVAIERAAGVDVVMALAQVTADEGLGLARGLICAGDDEVATGAQVARSVLRAQGAVATALSASACQTSVVASVLDARGSVDARALASDARVVVNSSYLRAAGARQATLVLAGDAAGELRNSVVAIAEQAAGLEVDVDADQWLALHHLLFEHQGRPLLTRRGEVLASDDAALVALRSRFVQLRSVDSAELDLDGHLQSAGSPAVDAADPATVSLEDIDGQARPLGAGPDLGPDEAY